MKLPPLTIVGLTEGVPRRGWRLSSALGPVGGQPVEPGEQGGRLLDRVDAAAVAPVRLVHLGVGRAALDRQRAVQEPARRDPEVQPGRLGDEPGVCPVPARDRGDRPHRAGLLVRHGLEDHVAGEPDAAGVERLEGEERRADAPFMSTAPRP